MSQALKNPKLAFKFLILFSIMMVLGLVPWEGILAIQIRNNVLSFLTNFLFGLFGLIGFLVSLWIFIQGNNRFTLSIKLLSGCLAVFLASVWVLEFALPTFNWYDTIVYRNGNDYLIVQEQETFVTSNFKTPRIVLTKSPYNAVRKIEAMYTLTDNDDRFGGAEVIYNGKRWFKQDINTK